MTEATKQLANFITETKYEDLPPETIRKAKMHILDCLGVSIGAYHTPWAQAVTGLIREYGGKEEAHLLVDGEKVPTINAALVNGTLAHSLEFDDAHILSTCHPGATIIPAALAIAEHRNSSGKDLLLSIILAYELMLRVGMAIFPSHRDKRKFHITATTGNLGAAAATAKLLDLDADACLNALGLAGDQAASGLFAFISDGTMSKRIHAGRAAMNGVLSALFAQRGITGGPTILEDEYGFLEAYADEYDIDKMVANLGKDFEILNCWCKQFPCCGHLQGLIRLASKISKGHDFKSDEIEYVQIGIYSDALVHNKYEINSSLDAQESASFAVAASLIRGDAYIKEFFEDYDDPEIAALMKKIKVQVDEEIDRHRGVKVTVKIRDGEEYAGREKESVTIGDEIIVEKFQRLTRDILPELQIQEIINILQRLEQERDVENLVKLTLAKNAKFK